MTRREWVRNLAWSVLVTPVVLLLPLSWPAISEPSLFLEHWDLYLLFFGLPFTAALALTLYLRHTRGSV